MINIKTMKNIVIQQERKKCNGFKTVTLLHSGTPVSLSFTFFLNIHFSCVNEIMNIWIESIKNKIVKKMENNEGPNNNIKNSGNWFNKLKNILKNT